ncbi:epoxide hydrolase [Apiospora kogelbergensis]|uniref:epoxide hydrolase n=1 Tax=Apiospora kogelbergensis TaxID=1337665 RepID=UPI00312E039D
MYGTFTDTTSIARIMAGDADQQPADDATAAGQTGSSPPDEEVKPYQLHVSTKYIDLTQQKLEITRLPHEQSEPNSVDWWEPKPLVEPLIDFWVEQYEWRSEEAALNELPQFRTGFTIPNAEAPIRVHFIHVRSAHTEDAIPLLLIPPFPLTCLSFGHILKSFTEPENGAQAFHLVIPSLPGLGFSDALPNNTPVISTTGEILNSLMHRLEYPHYLVTNAGSGAASPAQIDWKLASYLATQHPDACVGAHFISPPLAQPRLQETPIAWAKWSIAKLFSAPIFAYHKDDFSALKRNEVAKGAADKNSSTPVQIGLNHQLAMQEPNTLAYALCDSPTGLLVFVLKYLKLLAPHKEFTPTEVVNFTQLAWLPGPEAAMRFWAHSLHHPEISTQKKAVAKKWRPRVAITVFLGDEVAAAEAAGESYQEDAPAQIRPQHETKEDYACPAWAKTKYKVLHTHRASGKAGLLAWERPELIASGVRSLAQEVLKLDSRLKPSTAPATAPLERVVTGDDGGNAEVQFDDTAAAAAALRAAAMSPEIGPQLETPGGEIPPLVSRSLSSESALLAPIPESEERAHPRTETRTEDRTETRREDSSDTRVASDNEDKKDVEDNTRETPNETNHLLAKKNDEHLAGRPSPRPMYPLH